MRLFVGVGLSDAVRAAIARKVPPSGERAAGGGGAVRWIAPHNWHLTLQFLGHVDDAASDPLRAACAGAAKAAAPFELVLEGTGAFPSPRRARVLWIGVGRGHDRLAALAEALFTHTEPLGFPREARAFRAHLTVGRLKVPADVTPLLARLRVPALELRVEELTLFRSRLSSKGAEYGALETFPLSRRG